MSEYAISRCRDGLKLVYYDDAGKRHRYALGTQNAAEARRLAPSLYSELSRPRGKSVAELWQAYLDDRQGRAVIVTMRHTFKAIAPRFGPMGGDDISIEDCRAHTEERRRAGIKDGTIHTELGHLRMVLLWAVKHRLLSAPSYIERPPKPKGIERHLSREQVRALFDHAGVPHIRLFAILAYTTAARSAAIFGLTWDRCDFIREQIDLRDPTMNAPHKGRAIVPMLRTTRAALLEARKGALSDYVIEWAGGRIASVKIGLASAARAAAIGKVTPHMLRHSAAVHMAEDNVDMEEIAQFLGHDDMATTRKVYARFSPSHLRRAAKALEYDDLGAFERKAAT